MVEIKDRIKELREERGLTQKQLGEAIHFSVSTISKWEQGIKYPNISSLRQLAEFFNETTDYLLDMEGFRKRK